ncbi:MAG TPA: hypothetical protein VFP60_01700 [Pseudolabrys sp.]|nr:hypothetical protein [Pseudolabrys sp.]
MEPDDPLYRELDRLHDRLPPWARGSLQRARRPSAVWFRGSAAFLLIVGGILGFLPILGFWMVPLGVALAAIDIPFLRPPLARALAFINAKMKTRAD